MTTSSLPPPEGNPSFHTTHWTHVLAARESSEDGKEALRALCAAYYAPVAGFIERARYGPENVQDLTQDFFTSLLQRGIGGVDRDRGRFRAYLLGSVKHFLADVRDRAAADKRGGGVQLRSLPSEAAHDIDDPRALPPDAYFDREWALTLLHRVLTILEVEHDGAGREHEFEILKTWLMGDQERDTYAETALKLNVSEQAAKSAIHRLRRRFRQLVKAEIAGTVASPADVDAEMQYLIRALAFAYRE